LKKKVEEVLEIIRPSLQADGGDIELLGVKEEEGIVLVRLLGACGGCPFSQMTLKMGVEKILKDKIPEVRKVETV